MTEINKESGLMKLTKKELIGIIFRKDATEQQNSETIKECNKKYDSLKKLYDVTKKELDYRDNHCDKLSNKINVLENKIICYNNQLTDITKKYKFYKELCFAIGVMIVICFVLRLML